MFDYKVIKVAPYSLEDLFSLVSDVGRYQEFVPWVSKSRVYEEEGEKFLADLEISYGPFAATYTSNVQCLRNLKTPQIRATLVQGPFKHLESLWSFEDRKNGCGVSLGVSFESSQPFLFKLVEPFFPSFVERIMESFEERAAVLFK